MAAELPRRCDGVTCHMLLRDSCIEDRTAARVMILVEGVYQVDDHRPGRRPVVSDRLLVKVVHLGLLAQACLCTGDQSG